MTITVMTISMHYEGRSLCNLVNHQLGEFKLLDLLATSLVQNMHLYAYCAVEVVPAVQAAHDQALQQTCTRLLCDGVQGPFGPMVDRIQPMSGHFA